VQLTPTEFDLIAYFANNPGVALSRDQLISHIWGYDSEGQTRLLDSHVAHLRAKLESDPANPRLITTVRNIGYKLNPTPLASR
jgi:two-component system alkaline phosphatase synthesis response regulator PhoP